MSKTYVDITRKISTFVDDKGEKYDDFKNLKRGNISQVANGPTGGSDIGLAQSASDTETRTTGGDIDAKLEEVQIDDEARAALAVLKSKGLI